MLKKVQHQKRHVQRGVFNNTYSSTCVRLETEASPVPKVLEEPAMQLLLRVVLVRLLLFFLFLFVPVVVVSVAHRDTSCCPCCCCIMCCSVEECCCCCGVDKLLLNSRLSACRLCCLFRCLLLLSACPSPAVPPSPSCLLSYSWASREQRSRKASAEDVLCSSPASCPSAREGAPQARGTPSLVPAALAVFWLRGALCGTAFTFGTEW